MPSNTDYTMDYIDLIIRGPVGTVGLPVYVGATGDSAPPAGWQLFAGGYGDGAFCEWRGRTVTFESTYGGTGFAPRWALGWHFSLTPANAGECTAVPSAIYSYSLTGLLSAPWNTMSFADPSYGPSIRLYNTPDTAGLLYVATLVISEPKDEDRSPQV
jgi:hypothetical protein